MLSRSTSPLVCWLSSAPVHLSVGLGFGLQVSTRVNLPNKRCKSCRGDVPSAVAADVAPVAASQAQVGGLAWELQKRVGEGIKTIVRSIEQRYPSDAPKIVSLCTARRPPAFSSMLCMAAARHTEGECPDVKSALEYAESYGDVRGQLERGAEPIDTDFYARWLKSKGSLEEAETCIRAHAAWREAFVTRGRIHEVQYHFLA